MSDASETEWFTDNILQLPTPLLWEHSRSQGLYWGPQVFVFFWLRKLVGWRFRPAFGIARPSRLPQVNESDVPQDVLDRLAPARRVCKAAGFRPCLLTRPRQIGGRTAYAGLFLSEDALSVASVSLIRTAVGRLLAEQVTFVCQSQTSDGLWLVTQGLPPKLVRTDMILPGLDVDALPPDVDPSQVIDAHRRRIATRNDLVRFDTSSIAEAVLTESQRFFDWRVEKGLLAPLSERDVCRLTSSSP